MISPAETPGDFEAFGDVCRAYVEWCRERYRDMPWFVEQVFGYHRSVNGDPSPESHFRLYVAGARLLGS